MIINSPWAGSMAIAAVLLLGTAIDASLDGPSAAQELVDTAASVADAQAAAQAAHVEAGIEARLKRGQAQQDALLAHAQAHMERLDALARCHGEALQTLQSMQADTKLPCSATHRAAPLKPSDMRTASMACAPSKVLLAKGGV